MTTDPKLQQQYIQQALARGVSMGKIQEFLRGNPNDHHRLSAVEADTKTQATSSGGLYAKATTPVSQGSGSVGGGSSSPGSIGGYANYAIPGSAAAAGIAAAGGAAPPSSQNLQMPAGGSVGTSLSGIQASSGASNAGTAAPPANLGVDLSAPAGGVAESQPGALRPLGMRRPPMSVQALTRKAY